MASHTRSSNSSMMTCVFIVSSHTDVDRHINFMRGAVHASKLVDEQYDAANMRALRPDVVIIDREMQGLDIFECCRFLTEEIGCGVIVMSATRDMAEILLAHCADDFVENTIQSSELLGRIRALQRRLGRHLPSAGDGRFASPAVNYIVECGKLVIDTSKRSVKNQNGTELILTGAEFRIFLALLRAGGLPVSRDALSRAALDREWLPDDRSVDQLIFKVRQKLAIAYGGYSIIRNIRGQGYLIAEHIRWITEVGETAETGSPTLGHEPERLTTAQPAPAI